MYISLPECGHSLCQRCLITWFKSQEKTYREDPDEQRTRRQTVERILNNLRGRLHDMEYDEIAAEVEPSQFAPPIYTCPICRHAVPLRPTYNTPLRDIAIAVHGPTDEPIAEDKEFDEFFECVLDDIQQQQ